MDPPPVLCSSRCLGARPIFQSLHRLRRLEFGGPALEELNKQDLSGVGELEELTVAANNLKRFDDDSPDSTVQIQSESYGPMMFNPALVARKYCPKRMIQILPFYVAAGTSLGLWQTFGHWVASL